MKRFSRLPFLLLWGLAMLILGSCRDAVETPPTPEASQSLPSTSTPQPSPTPTPLTPTETPELGYASADPTGATITFWHPYNGAKQEKLQEQIETFNATNPWQITVLVESFDTPQEVSGRVLTFLNSEGSPHLILARPGDAGVLYQGEALVDLNPLLEDPQWGLSSEESADFFPGFWLQDLYPNFNGARLGLPLSGSMDLLFYNPDWLAELGFSSPPTSPAEFQDMACAASNQPYSLATAEGNQGYLWAPETTSSWILSHGGQVFDPASQVFNYGTDATLAALTLLQEVFQQGCGRPVPGAEEAQTAFVRGTALFAIASSLEIPAYQEAIAQEASFPLGVAPLPHTSPEAIQRVAGDSLSIVKTTQRDELAAWLVIQYLISPEAQAQWAQATGELPVRASTAELLQGYLASHPAYQAAFELLPLSSSRSALPNLASIQDLEQGYWATILTEGGDLPTQLAALTQEANARLADQLATIPQSPDPWAGVDPRGQTIRFWHHYPDARQATLHEIINEFNATNRWGITVVPEYKGSYGELFLEVLPLVGTPDAPDMIMAYQNQAAILYQLDGLLDLNGLVHSIKWGLGDEDVEALFPNAFSQDLYPIFDDVRLGFPLGRSMQVVYYNRDWMEELGATEPPDTPEAFKKLACAAANRAFSGSLGETSVGYAMSVDAYRFLSWAYAFGGQIFAAEIPQYEFNTPAIVDAMTFLQDLFDEGCLTLVAEQQEDLQAFSQGEALFTTASSFYLRDYETTVQEGAGFSWGIAPLPHTGETPSQIIYGPSVSILNTSPEKQLAAWLLLKHLSTPQIQARWVQASGYLPVSSNTPEYLSSYFEAHPTFQTALGLFPYGIPEPAAPGYDIVRDETKLVLFSILSGADILETLDDLTATANRILGDQYHP